MRLAPATAAFVLALAPESAGAASAETACPRPVRTSATGLLLAEKIRWRASRSLGTPSAGHLVRGVRLPREGLHFFTWDPIRKRSPNRARRRWGNDELVRVVLRVAAGFAARHPLAPRIGVGDLSRPRGGDFGSRFGGIGHVSHQNGLDVDVYYPRRDGAERPPKRPLEVDFPLAQDLVDRFVAAGAERVFVGPRTPLSGRATIVQRLVNHDNHLHARLPATTGGDERQAARRPVVARPARTACLPGACDGVDADTGSLSLRAVGSVARRRACAALRALGARVRGGRE